MRKFIFIIGIVFVMNFKGYYFDPCSPPDENGISNCLGISGRGVEPRVEYCDSTRCVEKILHKTGTKHLKSIYKIKYDDESASIIPVEIQYKATVKE